MVDSAQEARGARPRKSQLGTQPPTSPAPGANSTWCPESARRSREEVWPPAQWLPGEGGVGVAWGQQDRGGAVLSRSVVSDSL